VSFRYAAGINKPGFNPLAAQTSTLAYNLFGWGENTTYGQLGIGNTTNYSSPKQVGALLTWSNIAAGRNHTVVSKTDGTIWSWGRNTQGQLGLGNTTNYSSPVQVGALIAWSKVSARWDSTIATKTDGTLWS
jgi:alpha-tubulin suppressor-like RCC1 family protein